MLTVQDSGLPGLVVAMPHPDQRQQHRLFRVYRSGLGYGVWGWGVWGIKIKG